MPKLSPEFSFNSMVALVRGLALFALFFVALSARAQTHNTIRHGAESDFLRQVSKEWSELHFSVIREVLAATPEYSISAFVEGLKNSEDPKVLARMMAEMRGNEKAHLRMITLLKEKLDQKPELLERLTIALDEVELEFKNRPKLRPRVGQRLLSGSLMALEFYAIIYGSYTMGSMVSQNTMIEYSYVPFVSLTGLVVTSFIREIIQLKTTAPAIIREWLVRRRGGAAIQTLKLNLVQLRSDPQVVELLREQNYKGSEEFRTRAVEAILRIQEQYVAEADFLRTQGKWGEEVLMQKLALHKRLSNKLYKDLSTEEMHRILKSLRENPREVSSLPLGLRVKMEDLIHEVAKEQAKMERALATGPEYMALLRLKERDAVERVDQVVRARWSFHLNFAILSVSAAFLGAVYAVGAEPQAIDLALSPEFAGWLRRNHELILTTATATVIGGWLIQAVDTTMAFRRDKGGASNQWNYIEDHISNLVQPKPVGACRSLF